MKRLIPICIAIAALAVAGCGSSKKSTSSTPAPTSSGGGGGGQALKISADPNALKFNTTSLSAKAGKVTITMSNPGALSHDVAIEGNGVDEKGSIVGKGGTSTVSADLKPGTYTFYCSVDGHKDAGMKGTLTVK